MNITDVEGRDWRQWVLVTSIPLVRLGENNTVISVGSGTLIDHAGARFLLAVEHVVKTNAAGWAIVVQQDGDGRLEYYRPNFFTYVGEVRMSSGQVRMLDLCAAQVSPELKTWYEYRTPRGLFEKLPNIIFKTSSIAAPDPGQIYGFSGRVRTERHGRMRLFLTWSSTQGSATRTQSRKFTTSSCRCRIQATMPFTDAAALR